MSNRSAKCVLKMYVRLFFSPLESYKVQRATEKEGLCVILASEQTPDNMMIHLRVRLVSIISAPMTPEGTCKLATVGICSLGNVFQ